MASFVRTLMIALVSLCICFSAVPARPAQAAERTSFAPAVVLAYAQLLQHINSRLPLAQSLDYAQQVLLNAQRLGLDPHLLVALVTVESHWSARAVSPVGALGLGQLMPSTAASLAIDPTSPRQNLRGTSMYLRSLLVRFRNRPESTKLAVGAYNAGPNAIQRFGGVPPYTETRNYVRRVLGMWATVRSSLAKAESAARVDAEVSQLPPAPAIEIVAAATPDEIENREQPGP